MLLFSAMLNWLSTEKTYEGFPLMLRRPTNLDTHKLRPDFPLLASVTHLFSEQWPNGLPKPDYNGSLAEMDHEIIVAFDVDRIGTPALVETYGGKRNYYFYVATDADVPAVLSAIADRYPKERLSWSVRPDPEWIFIRGYAKDYF
jgi:hypothetical protein